MSAPLGEFLRLIDPTKLSDADKKFIPYLQEQVATRLEAQKAAEARPETAIAALQEIGVTAMELQPQSSAYEAFYGATTVGMIRLIAPLKTREEWRDQCFGRADQTPVTKAARSVGRDLITFLTEDDYRERGWPQGEYHLESTTSSPSGPHIPDRIGVAVIRGNALNHRENNRVASVDCFADYRFDIRLMGPRMMSRKIYADAWCKLRDYMGRFAQNDEEREKLASSSGRESVRINI